MNENQYAILDSVEKTDIVLYTLSIPAPPKDNENNGALDASSFSERKVGQELSPVQLSFDTEVDRIFSTPLGIIKYNSSSNLSFLGYYHLILVIYLYMQNQLSCMLLTEIILALQS